MEEAVWNAAQRGDLQLLKRLFYKRIPSADTMRKATCVAAANGHVEALDYLCGWRPASASAKFTTFDAETRVLALKSAATHGSTSAAASLVQKWGVHPTDEIGRAVLGGHGDVVKLLLAHKADPDYAHHACAQTLCGYGKGSDVVRHLLAAKVSATTRRRGFCLTDAAAAGGCERTVHACVAAVRLEAAASGAGPNEVRATLCSALAAAIRVRQVRAARLLLAARAHVDGATFGAAHHTLTSLCAFCCTPPSRLRASCSAVVRLLVRSRADPANVYALHGDGPASLTHLAARFGQTDLVADCLAARPDAVHRTDSSWGTPLSAAVRGQHASTVAYLLEAKASANAEATPLMGSPLHVAALGSGGEGAGSCAVLRLLIAAKADLQRVWPPWRPGCPRSTALRVAVRRGPPEAVELLASFSSAWCCGAPGLLRAARKRGCARIVHAVLVAQALPR